MAPSINKPADAGEPAGTSHEPVFNAAAYLERTLPRKPGDFLKVFPMHNRSSFRVNWYANRPPEKATMPGLNIAYVRESKFLFCRLNVQGTPEITYPDKQ